MKKVLDEMSHMETRLLDAIVGRCADLECRMEESEQKTEARLISLEMDYGQIEGWKPEVEKRLKNLMLELKRANKIMERGILENDGPQHGLLRPEGSTAARTSVGIHTVDGPNGYRGDHDHRDRGFGHVTFQTHGPVKGMSRNQFHHRFDSTAHMEHHSDSEFGREGSRSDTGNLPRVNFPQFDDENPQL